MSRGEKPRKQRQDEPMKISMHALSADVFVYSLQRLSVILDKGLAQMEPIDI